MSSPGTPSRQCSRQTCRRDAVMTLTYVYSDSTAVVGPLAGHAEPHAYDLCGVHADRLTVPRGWRVLRLETPETGARREDVAAVAETVRGPRPERSLGGRGRTVLRDVSLPRTAGPTPLPSRGTTADPEPIRGTGPARRPAPETTSVPRPERQTRPAPRQSPELTSVPRPGREAASAARPRRGPAPAPGPVREAGTGLVRHDVPMPESMRRAHLRRPAVGGVRARPEA